MKNQPVDPRVRLAISRWPDDAPRGSVTTFCDEHGISRKTFYAIRARARDEGPAAVLEPKSRRPRSSPTRIGEDTKQQALDVRVALEASGLDFGPISVHDKMRDMGLHAPSIASLARIFREKGVARAEPKKKPRAAYRRFVYPAPNACWQLDATEYVLTGGRKCVIFQLEDDHSRVAVASHVGRSENSEDAVTVMRKGIAARGVPQRLLTDNGSALNPWRRGWTSDLVAYAASFGVEAITGKPGRPTTQGKNERFHQTLLKWLDKQPLASSIEELQAHVDRFDLIYNTERGHQGLPGRMTPQQSWDATPVAEPPRPKPAVTELVIPASRRERTPDAPLTAKTRPSTPAGEHRDDEQPPVVSTRAATMHRERGQRELKVRVNGAVMVRKIEFHLSKRLAGETIHAVWDHDGIVFVNQHGELIAQHTWPQPGTTYVGNGLAHGRVKKPRRNKTLPSPKS